MGFAYDEVGPPALDVPQKSNGQRGSDPQPWPVQPTPGPEDEIGDLLLQVQRFVDETAHEAERNARAIIEGAKAEANRIVEQSRQQANQNGRAIIELAQVEANRVVEESRRVAAQRPISTPLSVDPQVVSNLTNAIAEFAGTNRLLLDELVQLRNALAASPLSPS